MEMTKTQAQRYRTRAWELARSERTGSLADFARHLREVARPTQIAYQRLMLACGGQPAGVECRMEGREAWAFVLPNVHGDEPWRVQYFDLDGFSGHTCHKTLEGAVEDMLNMGYRIVDAGALDRVALTVRWTFGVRRAAVMQKHQEGLISFKEMNDELRAMHQ